MLSSSDFGQIGGTGVSTSVPTRPSRSYSRKARARTWPRNRSWTRLLAVSWPMRAPCPQRRSGWCVIRLSSRLCKERSPNQSWVRLSTPGRCARRRRHVPFSQPRDWGVGGVCRSAVLRGVLPRRGDARPCRDPCQDAAQICEQRGQNSRGGIARRIRRARVPIRLLVVHRIRDASGVGFGDRSVRFRGLVRVVREAL